MIKLPFLLREISRLLSECKKTNFHLSIYYQAFIFDSGIARSGESYLSKICSANDTVLLSSEVGNYSSPWNYQTGISVTLHSKNDYVKMTHFVKIT